MYLVLRVCRACNHRGTAKRPSTPSHSASRHSIFFSPRPRAPSVVPGAHRLSPFPGPELSPLSRRERWCRLFFSSPPYHPLTPGASSRRCAHSIIIIGFRSWTADARRASLSLSFSPPFHFHSFGSSFPSSRLFTHASLARVPNSVALNYGWADEATTMGRSTATRAPTLPPVLLFRRAENLTRRKFITETRALILDPCANSPRRDCIYL